MDNKNRRREFVIFRYYPNGRVSFITSRDDADKAQRVVDRMMETNPNAEYQILGKVY
jgi:hypothetical protein